MAKLTGADYQKLIKEKISLYYSKSGGKAAKLDDGFWLYFQQSEQLLIDLINGIRPPDDAPGDVEFGPVLYIANNDMESWITDFLRDTGMPPSQITPQEWQAFLNDVGNGPGLVAGDGSLFIENVPYAGLDPNWVGIALVSCIFYRTFPEEMAPFPTGAAAVISISGQNAITIAVMGDFGTGSWNDGNYASPAMLVRNCISYLNPMITMHLGDVYYAGLSGEESSNLLEVFPSGSMYNFTLNSNHEMYDGANGYFNEALANQYIFPAQNGHSYFAVKFLDWVIIGLDTAYFDNRSYTYMDGELSDAYQLDFINSLGITPEQKILIFTHHNGLSIDGNTINPPSSGTPLFDQLVSYLGDRCPDVWYYGHIHNGVVYSQNSPALQPYITEYGLRPMVRCMGHAAIPYGFGYQVSENTQNFDCYTSTPVPDPSPLQQNRILNGFALLTLTQSAINEDIYEVPSDGSAPVLMWSYTTNF